MKAWACVDENAECGYIVFAETRAKAKTLVLREAGFDCSEWCDVEVRRLKEFDDRKNVECVADWRADERIYYEAQWHPADDSECCEKCDRYEYAGIAESFIVAVNGVNLCLNCRTQPAKRGGQLDGGEG